MHRPPLPRLVGTAVVGLLTVAAAGCGPSPKDNEGVSRQQFQTFEQDFPDLARAMGAATIDTLREDTCLLNASWEDKVRRTHVTGRTNVQAADRATAEAVGRSVRAQAEHQGWQTLPEDSWSSGGGHVLYQGHRPDLAMTLTVYMNEHPGGASVTMAATTECLDMPGGHVMTASPLDRNIDTSYRQGDALYHAIPDARPGSKPLPESTQTPAPTGPSGITAEQTRDPQTPTPSPAGGFLDDAVQRP